MTIFSDLLSNQATKGGQVSNRGTPSNHFDVDFSPKVSILIPAYNMASSLEVAVASCLQQTISDFEIIIIDDGSSDGTIDVANYLAKKSKCIRVLGFVENCGKSACMNFGMEQALGKWVAVLDADDWYDPARIEVLINLAEQAGVDMVADNLALIDLHAHACVGTLFPQKGKTFEIGLHEHLKSADITAMFHGYGMLKPIIRRNILKKISLKYYEPASFSQDFYFLLSYFALGGKCIVIDTPYYYYNQPFGFISRKPSRPQRRRYKYEVLEQVHYYFGQLYNEKFSPIERKWMQKRAEGIKLMIAFHQLRECIRAGDIRGTLQRLNASGFNVIPLILKKVFLFTLRHIKYRFYAQRSTGIEFYFPKDLP